MCEGRELTKDQLEQPEQQHGQRRGGGAGLLLPVVGGVQSLVLARAE